MVMIMILHVVRYNADGSLDNTFRNKWNCSHNQSEQPQNMHIHLAEQNNGKILAAGYSWNGNDNDFAIVRYNKDGSLDDSFGNNGKMITGIGISTDYGRSVVVEKDGGILVGGYSSNGANYSVFTIVKYIGDAVTGISEKENTKSVPERFVLNQNYPNPI